VCAFLYRQRPDLGPRFLGPFLRIQKSNQLSGVAATADLVTAFNATVSFGSSAFQKNLATVKPGVCKALLEMLASGA
jgi:hypothetical protein